MRHSYAALIAATLLVVIAFSACGEGPSSGDGDEPTADPTASPPEPKHHDFDPDNFGNSTVIDNEWMPMHPGTRWIFKGFTSEEDEKIPHRLEFTVTDLTKEIQGVRTVVGWIEDFSDGQLVEKEIAFYAQDNDGNVWYFGEHPEEYEEGKFVNAPTWIAGFEDAKPGIAMWAEPQPAIPPYFQGWGPAVDWTDYGLVDKLVQKVCVPAACYEDIVVIAESSLGETGAFQLKYYASGVGEVRVGWRGELETPEGLQLVEHTQISPEALTAIRTDALALEAHAYEISTDLYALTAPSEVAQPEG